MTILYEKNVTKPCKNYNFPYIKKQGPPQQDGLIYIYIYTHRNDVIMGALQSAPKKGVYVR